jgi:hypothetical protein
MDGAQDSDGDLWNAMSVFEPVIKEVAGKKYLGLDLGRILQEPDEAVRFHRFTVRGMCPEMRIGEEQDWWIVRHCVVYHSFNITNVSG